jgi:hypothetical protein
MALRWVTGLLASSVLQELVSWERFVFLDDGGDPCSSLQHEHFTEKGALGLKISASQWGAQIQFCHPKGQCRHFKAVKPGMIVSEVNGEDVRSMAFKHVQRRLSNRTRPMRVGFGFGPLQGQRRFLVFIDGRKSGGPEALLQLLIALVKAGLPAFATAMPHVHFQREYNATSSTSGVASSTISQDGRLLVHQLLPADLKAGDVFIVPEVYQCPFSLLQRGVRVVVWQLAVERDQAQPTRRDGAGRGCESVGHSVYTADWLEVPVGASARQDGGGKDGGGTHTPDSDTPSIARGSAPAAYAFPQGDGSAAVWRPYITPSTSAERMDWPLVETKEDLVIVDGDIIWAPINDDGSGESVWDKVRARGRIPELKVAVASGKSHEEMQSLLRRAKACVDLQMRTSMHLLHATHNTRPYTRPYTRPSTAHSHILLLNGLFARSRQGSALIPLLLSTYCMQRGTND